MTYMARTSLHQKVRRCLIVPAFDIPYLTELISGTSSCIRNHIAYCVQIVSGTGEHILEWRSREGARYRRHNDCRRRRVSISATKADSHARGARILDNGTRYAT